MGRPADRLVKSTDRKKRQAGPCRTHVSWISLTFHGPGRQSRKSHRPGRATPKYSEMLWAGSGRAGPRPSFYNLAGPGRGLSDDLLLGRAGPGHGLSDDHLMGRAGPGRGTSSEKVVGQADAGRPSLAQPRAGPPAPAHEKPWISWSKNMAKKKAWTPSGNTSAQLH